jgi:hypothetical protein
MNTANIQAAQQEVSTRQDIVIRGFVVLTDHVLLAARLQLFSYPFLHCCGRQPLQKRQAAAQFAVIARSFLDIDRCAHTFFSAICIAATIIF